MVDALADMSNQIRAYLVWRTIINFAMALFLGMTYYLLGLSQPPILSVNVMTWSAFRRDGTISTIRKRARINML